MSIRKHTYINAKGEKVHRTTVSYKLFGVRNSTTYVETDEERKQRIARETRASSKSVAIVVIAFCVFLFIILFGFGVKEGSALACSVGGFFCVCSDTALCA